VAETGRRRQFRARERRIEGPPPGTVKISTGFQALNSDRLAEMRRAALTCRQERYGLKAGAGKVEKALDLG